MFQDGSERGPKIRRRPVPTTTLERSPRPPLRVPSGESARKKRTRTRRRAPTNERNVGELLHVSSDRHRTGRDVRTLSRRRKYQTDDARTPSILNSVARIHGLCPFTPERFHVLLNSLFKVLFNFPSRYLSAIGLVVVFSLRWSLPPA